MEIIEATTSVAATPAETETENTTKTFAFPPVDAPQQCSILGYYQKWSHLLFLSVDAEDLKRKTLHGIFAAQDIANSISNFRDMATPSRREQDYDQYSARFAFALKQLKAVNEYFESEDMDMATIVARASELVFVLANLDDIWEDINPFPRR